jgi:hypothetical protein
MKHLRVGRRLHRVRLARRTDHGLRLVHYGIPTRWAMLRSRLNNEPGPTTGVGKCNIQWASA